MPNPTIPASFAAVDYGRLITFEWIRAADVEDICEMCHWQYAKRVHSLGGDVQVRSVPETSATYVQPCGIFEVTTGSNVNQIGVLTVAEDGDVRVQLDDGATTKTVVHSHASGAASQKLTWLTINPEEDYTVTIEIKKGTTSIAYDGCLLFERQLEEGDL